MFPVGPQLEFIVIVGVVLLGMAMGLVAGTVFALALGLRVQGLLKDALLGALGFAIALIVSMLARYGNRLDVAFFLALLFPLIRQFSRLRQQDSSSQRQ
jgi:ABC-type antimicrobial peptide transport system permease subunit